jgi:ATP-dependent DNA helicase RecG
MPEQQNIEYKQSWHDDYLKSDHNSRPRNPIIANACFFAGYIDTWGRGTLKIINSCKEAGLPEPEIKEMNGGVEVTLFISEVSESGLVDGLVDGLADGLVENETGGQTGGAIGGVLGGAIGGAKAVLTDRQKEVLDLIISNNRITYKEIVEKLSINESAIADHIKALKDKGVIKRAGKTRGQWLILIEVK